MARPSRRSIRLKGYDYAQPGAYYVTICTAGRLCIFGEVAADAVQLSPIGSIVEATWKELPQHYPFVELDSFVVMPNHVHGVLFLLDEPSFEGYVVGAGLRPARKVAGQVRHSLSEVVRAFKTFSARRINAARGARGASVWQRNYYERIVRDEKELERIREYIDNNPAQWEADGEHPALTSRRAMVDDIERVVVRRGGRV
jgi:REP element-mobilizing transposase RayT